MSWVFKLFLLDMFQPHFVFYMYCPSLLPFILEHGFHIMYFETNQTSKVSHLQLSVAKVLDTASQHESMCLNSFLRLARQHRYCEEIWGIRFVPQKNGKWPREKGDTIL